MSDRNVVIHAEGVSKVFRLGARENRPDSLSGSLISFLKRPLANYRKYRALYRFDDVQRAGEETAQTSPADIIWALRDVSFEIRQGEAVGIVGRNGAGKSTLLKLLSKITPPTSGQIELRGRVSSLLEVGTGFHQELTGRENIYLNGTILGMTKKEIDRKFDEIVDFSGVERFIDTPVKRYSSGMTVRLAFAVAAHLEPEILIVDEVLAVGDAAFQKKCIGKMKEIGKEGRTILFVSHNMPAVSMLCSRAILLDGGRKTMEGTAHDVVRAYLMAGTGTPSARVFPDPQNAPGGELARLRSARIVTRDGRVVDTLDVREEVGMEMVFEVNTPGFMLMPNYWVYNEEGIVAFAAVCTDPEWRERPWPTGRYTSTAWIPGNFLAEGTFFVSCALHTRMPAIDVFDEPQLIAFHVADSIGEGTARGDWPGEMPGVVRPLLTWTTRHEPVETDTPEIAAAQSREGAFRG
jgi:lipopolysaccharide transport system ATP-binding protein